MERNFTCILHIVFIIICFIHLIFIFYNNSNPAIPEIIIHNKNIMDLDMPLSFIFCLSNTNPELEDEKYKKAGYMNIRKFFSGTSMYNESVVGWLGHMKNGSTFDSLDGKWHNFWHTKKTKLILTNF